MNTNESYKSLYSINSNINKQNIANSSHFNLNENINNNNNTNSNISNFNSKVFNIPQNIPLILKPNEINSNDFNNNNINKSYTGIGNSSGSGSDLMNQINNFRKSLKKMNDNPIDNNYNINNNNNKNIENSNNKITELTKMNEKILELGRKMGFANKNNNQN